MVFSSITFLLYFLPLVLVVYYIVPKSIKNIVLLVFSLFFYFWGEPKYLSIMVFLIVFTYIGGLILNKFRDKKYIKVILFGLVLGNLAALIYFKYIDFIIENVNLFLNRKIDLIGVILPIGISFYTFQTMSYLVDVYRGKVEVQKNLTNLAMYVSFFPQLIAGPIVRYIDIEKQLNDRVHTIEKFSNGIRRFIIGLTKKVLIANILGELINLFSTSGDKTVLFYWMYAIANMLQIYFDFSGYSDMAIGLGKMFGFEFLENFNYPYIATSITDFWRRWHISLSSWFRDYVYIPLGGNRKGIVTQIRNILIVWALTGFWHGANWNFIIWGVYFGIILIIEKLFLLKVLEKTPKIISRIYVLFVVLISFIIFSNENISILLENIKGLFNVSNGIISNVSLYYFESYFVTFVVAAIASIGIMNKLVEKCNKKIINIVEPVYLIVLLIVSISYIVDGSFNPFLYFRF